MEDQIEAILREVRGILGENLVGAYLHGSSVLGGLRPRSDIDFIIVTSRRTTPEDKRTLVDLLLAFSGRGESLGSPRPIELDLVVESEIRPWRYPPRFDFHYSELLREEFEGGNFEPWSSTTNRDLAALVTMARAAETSLYGPPPAEMFDPVPSADYHDAILKDIEQIDRWIVVDTRNVVLTLARVWAGLSTSDLHSKESAASWALARLAQEYRPVLERARAIYRGESEEYWDDVRPQVQAYANCLVAEIKRAPAYSTLRGSP